MIRGRHERICVAPSSSVPSEEIPPKSNRAEKRSVKVAVEVGVGVEDGVEVEVEFEVARATSKECVMIMVSSSIEEKEELPGTYLVGEILHEQSLQETYHSYGCLHSPQNWPSIHPE